MIEALSQSYLSGCSGNRMVFVQMYDITRCL